MYSSLSISLYVTNYENSSFIYLTYCLLLQRLYVQFNFMRGFYFILCMSWDYMICIVTRVWAGQLKYCGSIPSKV